MSDFVLDETERMTGHGKPVRRLSIVLTVLDGPEKGLRATIDGARATVGSAEGSALRLTDRAVSRIHCELEPVLSGHVVTLRDLGSTNGTFVGEARVRDADLPIGAIVRCGASAFRLDAAEALSFVEISQHDSFGELVGGSLEMRRVYAVLERVATSGTTLLVQGETGTGKDVVARSVHAASNRKSGPFVPVDCGAIPEPLFESELFGHVRGAFTGAVNNRAGAFEEAHGGTLFLDEIGEMPLAMQAKLLRVIETRRVRRVGGPREIDVDVRIICATNRRLAEMVNDGTFREDLFYRLAVVEVLLPPLRTRREDIPALATNLYVKITGRPDPPPAHFLESLASRAWPGNVRELRNAIERAATLGQIAEGPAADPKPRVLPAGLASLLPLDRPLKEARLAWTSEFESLYVQAMLDKTSGNITRAAELAGVSRRFLQRTLARLGIRHEDDGD